MADQDSFVDAVSEKESMEFLSEGLKKASSAARQLAAAQNHPIWADISKMLEEMQRSCIDLARSKALSRTQTLKILDHRETLMSNALDKTRAASEPKKKFLMN